MIKRIVNALDDDSCSKLESIGYEDASCVKLTFCYKDDIDDYVVVELTVFDGSDDFIVYISHGDLKYLNNDDFKFITNVLQEVLPVLNNR